MTFRSFTAELGLTCHAAVDSQKIMKRCWCWWWLLWWWWWWRWRWWIAVITLKMTECVCQQVGFNISVSVYLTELLWFLLSFDWIFFISELITACKDIRQKFNLRFSGFNSLPYRYLQRRVADIIQFKYSNWDCRKRNVEINSKIHVYGWQFLLVSFSSEYSEMPQLSMNFNEKNLFNKTSSDI